ncbi:MAG: transcription antitermination factor NusB [Myxococcota bacterium]
MSTRGARRQAREAALQVLYAADVSDRLSPEGVELVYQQVEGEFSLPSRSRPRALELALGVQLNLKRIDERIGLASRRWRVERLATVDRNILRIATYELLFELDTPVEVIIDEALEVARRFSSEPSTAFVNGVLDEIARDRTNPPR